MINYNWIKEYIKNRIETEENRLKLQTNNYVRLQTIGCIEGLYDVLDKINRVEKA